MVHKQKLEVQGKARRVAARCRNSECSRPIARRRRSDQCAAPPANQRCAVGLLPLVREEFRLLTFILHSELRRRAASRRALPCPSSSIDFAGHRYNSTAATRVACDYWYIFANMRKRRTTGDHIFTHCCYKIFVLNTSKSSINIFFSKLYRRIASGMYRSLLSVCAYFSKNRLV